MNPTHDESHPHAIVVTGVGQAFAQPTQATVFLGVSTTAPTASEAVAHNSRVMHQVIAAMHHIGIAETEVATATFTLRPQYSRRQQTERRLVGFDVTQLVRVTLASTRVSDVLDTAVKAGANQINTIAFDLPREAHRALEAEARRNAVADARAKAETIATSLGVTIIGVTSAIEGGASLPSPSAFRGVATLAEAPPITPPSEATVAVSLRITYRID